VEVVVELEGQEQHHLAQLEYEKAERKIDKKTDTTNIPPQ